MSQLEPSATQGDPGQNKSMEGSGANELQSISTEIGLHASNEANMKTSVDDDEFNELDLELLTKSTSFHSQKK